MMRIRCRFIRRYLLSLQSPRSSRKFSHPYPWDQNLSVSLWIPPSLQVPRDRCKGFRSLSTGTSCCGWRFLVPLIIWHLAGFHCLTLQSINHHHRPRPLHPPPRSAHFHAEGDAIETGIEIQISETSVDFGNCWVRNRRNEVDKKNKFGGILISPSLSLPSSIRREISWNGAGNGKREMKKSENPTSHHHHPSIVMII